MSIYAAEANDHLPSAAHTPPLINIDPDFYVPAERGNSFARAFRILLGQQG